NAVDDALQDHSALGQLALALLLPVDLGEDGDDASGRGALLAVAVPVAVRVVLADAARFVVAGQSLADPLLLPAHGLGNAAGLSAGAQDILEPGARPDRVAGDGEPIAVSAVAGHEPIIRVVQGKSVGQRLDAVDELLARPADLRLALPQRRFQALLLGDV